MCGREDTRTVYANLKRGLLDEFAAAQGVPGSTTKR
jgi:hypothetical protein